MADSAVHAVPGGTVEEPRVRQLVDWSSAIWAGLISGGVLFVLFLTLLPLTLGGSPWVYLRLMASPILGSSILAPPATFHAGALVAALAVALGGGVVGAGIIAYCLHRGGLYLGILGGAAFGVAYYWFDFYVLSLFIPWLFAARDWSTLLIYAIAGAVAGGVYEALEVEIFVPDEEAEA